MEIFKRVVEVDMCYSYLVYFIAVAMGTPYVPLAIFGIPLIASNFIITLGHLKDNWKIRLAGKTINVACTFTAFINIFASHMFFNDWSINIE